MLDDIELEQAVQDLLIDICEIMHRRGYELVPVGAMMRLVGVDHDRAQKHDNEFFALDADFKKLLKQRKKPVPRQAPSGATLH